MSADSKKAVVVAFLINLTIAIIKLFAAVLSGSKAMLAEGFHSVADSFNQLFLLLGMRLAGRGRQQAPVWLRQGALLLVVRGGAGNLPGGWGGRLV